MYVVVEEDYAGGLSAVRRPGGGHVYDDLGAAHAACVESQAAADGAGHPAWFRLFELREVQPVQWTLIVTGSRDFGDEQLVWDALDEQYAAHGPFFLRVGDCKDGADRFARAWARAHPDCPGRMYPADWALWRSSKHAAGGGPGRNADMVRDGAHACLGFWAPPPAKNRGTTGCARLARDAGIKVLPYGHVPAEFAQEALL